MLTTAVDGDQGDGQRAEGDAQAHGELEVGEEVISAIDRTR